MKNSCRNSGYYALRKTPKEFNADNLVQAAESGLLKQIFKQTAMTFWLKAIHITAQRNTLGIEKCTVTPCALKVQHIVENKYIALSGRNFSTHFPTQRDALGYRIFPQRDALGYRIFPQRDALGYHIFGFQPKLLYFKTQ